MPLSREELVAEWRSRLAATEEISAGATSRPAWLVHVQRRLYRFLLSLYGSGQWRTTALPDSSSTRIRDEQSVVFDAADVLPLAGKPAKQIGKIRQVLKAVATAQDEPLPAGPLVDGLPAEGWITVAIVKRGIDPSPCVRLLCNRHFMVRVQSRGADLAVEVPATERHAALKLLAAQKRREMYSRGARIPPLPIVIFWTINAAMFAPIPAIPALVITHSSYPNALAGEHTIEAALYALALFAAFSSMALVRPIAQLILAADRLAMRAWAMLKRRFFPKR